MRFSKAFIPTLKETPAEAEIPSHRLMIRSGMLRKLGSGLYTYLPLAQRVIHKIEKIVREELDSIGCQELLMPIIQPEEIWQLSGRWDVYGPELMRLEDRHERMFALGPTHEEVITLLAKYDIKSYRELPLNLYQIQTKFRDEIRPRFGVMRAREFTMKDAYSFHTDKSSLKETYKKMFEAYSRIFTRCGLEFSAVEADVGAIGGSDSHEFMALAETGESEVLNCECGYAATKENCKTAPLENIKSEKELTLEKVHTPKQKSVEEVSNFLNVDKKQIIKTIIYNSDKELVAFLIRGDREINNIKVANLLKSVNLEFATDHEIATETDSVAGFVGPVGDKKIRIFADKNLKDSRNMITGADEIDYHYKNVNLARDCNITKYVDIIQAEAGDKCPKCEKRLDSYRGIEVGQIFQLGDKYSKTMEATFTDSDGKEIPFEMGCYGIGITRTMAAAIEQNYDDYGIKWPPPIAPYQVELINLSTKNDEIVSFCDKLYEEFQRNKTEILYDDRDIQPGVKFNDADLIGIPLQIVVGQRNFKKDKIEYKLRHENEKITIEKDKILKKVLEIIEELT